MLSSSYTYLFLDFETTGLDTIKDDPIQIGLLAIDAEGKETARFSSAIKPHKSISELKSIVTYLTNTSLEELQHAPEFHDLFGFIKPFLQNNSVLIGHNIAFDLAFLQRYINREPVMQIDTFPLCKTCLHFLPSYALEVVANSLGISATKAHDALEDCIMNKAVFMHCINHIQTIRKEYMILDWCFQNSDADLSKIIKRTHKPYTFDNKELFLPPLLKPAFTNKKIVRDPKDIIMIPEGNNFIGNSTLKHLLTTIERGEKQRILSFSHKAKATIAEHLLSQQGIHTATFQEGVIFVPERIDRFLHKPQFDTAELSFVIKYLSHHSANHTLMDINSSDDRKIMHALTTKKPFRAGELTLCTHEELYEKKHPIDPQTHIIYFDTDRRRQSRANRASKPLDPVHLIQAIDHALYALEFDQNPDHARKQSLEHRREKITLFFGILGGQLDGLFKGYADKTIELEPLLDTTRIPLAKAAFASLIEEKDFPEKERIIQVFSEGCIVEKNMYNGDKRRYTFKQQTPFHTFDELQAELPEAKRTFLSTLQSSRPALTRNSIQSLAIIEGITNPNTLITRISTLPANIFILTSSKSHAQDLFSKLVAAGITNEWLIVAENITGGMGKVIYNATKSTKPVLMIGGFTCYCASRAKKFAISTLIPYYCEGKQKPLLLADTQFYA